MPRGWGQNRESDGCLSSPTPAGPRSFRTAQLFVDHVAAHTVSGSHVVLGTKIGQRALEILNQALVPIGDGDAGGAPPPKPPSATRSESGVRRGHPIQLPVPSLG